MTRLTPAGGQRPATATSGVMQPWVRRSARRRRTPVGRLRRPGPSPSVLRGDVTRLAPGRAERALAGGRSPARGELPASGDEHTRSAGPYTGDRSHLEESGATHAPPVR